EKRHGGEYDEGWPEWYAAYMLAEQAGTELPE
ncbi:MAG: glyoxalase, partial [Actinomycetota bacterium]